MNGLALCSGIEGIGLGLKIACPEYRTVCHVEREAYAAAVLVKRMEEGWLDPAPIWDDLSTFDGNIWRGHIDIITAGLPCQPYSVAGRREGDKDERYIWPEFFRIVKEVQPPLVFLENVPGLLAWFQPIGEELSSLGYTFEAGLFSAAEVGASHKRNRLFILAHSQHGKRWEENTLQARRLPASNDSGSVGNAGSSGLEGGELETLPREGRGEEGRAVAESSLPPFPPGPGDREAWAAVLREWPELAPAVENPNQQPDRSETRGDEISRKEVKRSTSGASRSSHKAMDDSPCVRRGEAEQVSGQREESQSDADRADGQVADSQDVRGPEERRESKERVLREAERAGNDGNREEKGVFRADPEQEAAQSAVCVLAPRLPAGMEQRVDQLRALGNGVVPLTAAWAFVNLARKLGVME